MFACSSNDDNGNVVPPMQNNETVIVFFPYTVNLYNYLSNNIKDIEAAMLRRENNPNVLVYINETKKSSCLYSIRKKGNECVHDTLRIYDNHDYTTVEGLSSLFSEMKTLTPNTKDYKMIIGCHGMGWIFGDDYNKVRTLHPMMFKEEYEENPITRWIGVGSAAIDIDMFAQAMDRASLHTKLMLFDVCYMGNIESLYELRHTSDYIIASSIEIMGKGMPYQLLWDDIIANNTQSIDNICNKFYTYYNNSDQPYAAIAGIDCSKLDNLAAVVKDINLSYTFPDNEFNSLQMLDGYRPSLFFDMGRYIELQCKDDALMQRYNQAMNEVVFTKYNTAEYYTALTQGARGVHEINYCSGLTTSAPSVNELSKSGWERTSWYKATH